MMRRDTTLLVQKVGAVNWWSTIICAWGWKQCDHRRYVIGMRARQTFHRCIIQETNKQQWAISGSQTRWSSLNIQCGNVDVKRTKTVTTKTSGNEEAITQLYLHAVMMHKDTISENTQALNAAWSGYLILSKGVDGWNGRSGQGVLVDDKSKQPWLCEINSTFIWQTTHTEKLETANMLEEWKNMSIDSTCRLVSPLMMKLHNFLLIFLWILPYLLEGEFYVNGVPMTWKIWYEVLFLWSYAYYSLSLLPGMRAIGVLSPQHLYMCPSKVWHA